MKAIGAIIEALHALQLDLYQTTGVELPNFEGALERVRLADEEDRAWIREELADLRRQREDRGVWPRGTTL